MKIGEITQGTFDATLTGLNEEEKLVGSRGIGKHDVQGLFEASRAVKLALVKAWMGQCLTSKKLADMAMATTSPDQFGAALAKEADYAELALQMFLVGFRLAQLEMQVDVEAGK